MKFNSYKILSWLFLVIAFSIGNAPAQNSGISNQDDIEDDLKLVPCKSTERLEGVKKLFVTKGAKEKDISTEKFGKGENLIVKFKGKTDETIIVGAHYDKVDVGCGAIDNWTGLVIMAHLYKTISQYEVDKSYIFVAFDQEENGLLGSKAMVKTIPKENYSKYCAMVNIDSFGFTAPQAADNMSDLGMVRLAKKVAEAKKFPFNHAVISRADSDSSSFLAKNIPSITFHGLAPNWRTFLHGSNDKLENIEARSVYVGYRFIFEYLTELEITGCRNFQ
jgi:Zn-dependent M28 family amino/carboxypeptidase